MSGSLKWVGTSNLGLEVSSYMVDGVSEFGTVWVGIYNRGLGVNSCVMGGTFDFGTVLVWAGIYRVW
uniref:Uncharacterized protein n=1 Tax=Octopus bimaculoides TaxID=37653 RepID=A0A0L8HHP2_OCTBM